MERGREKKVGGDTHLNFIIRSRCWFDSKAMMCVCEIRTSDLCIGVLCSGEQNLIIIWGIYWFACSGIYMVKGFYCIICSQLHGVIRIVIAEVQLCKIQKELFQLSKEREDGFIYAASWILQTWFSLKNTHTLLTRVYIADDIVLFSPLSVSPIFSANL